MIGGSTSSVWCVWFIWFKGLLGYPTEDGLARVLVSPLTSLQLGLRFLAVLYFGEGQAHLLAKKRLP